MSAQRRVVLDGVGQLGHHAVAGLARQVGRAGHVLHLKIVHFETTKTKTQYKSPTNRKALGNVDTNKLLENLLKLYKRENEHCFFVV